MQARGKEWGQGKRQEVPAGTARTARCDHRFCNRGEKRMGFTKELCSLPRRGNGVRLRREAILMWKPQTNVNRYGS